MTITLTGNLRLDVDIPLLNGECFEVEWKPGVHAKLKLEGYLQPEVTWNMAQVYGSNIKIWLEEDGGEQVLFHGLLKDISEKTIAGTRKIYIEGISASSLLDQKEYSRSFQNVNKSYYNIIQEITEADNGQVICTADKTLKPEKPTIQYKETNWDYSRRLASHLGVILIPDIETGDPNFWIGMRKGETVPSFSEAWYLAELDTERVQYWVRSTESYQLGDKTTFLGGDVILHEKLIQYQNGELQYCYLLGDEMINSITGWDKEEFTGLCLDGTVQAVEGEFLSLVLDIDNGTTTGEFFYEWLPETGNILYAMPEVGSPVSLYFSSTNEQDGIAVHCLHRKPSKQHKKSDYKYRSFDVLGNQSIMLSQGSAALSKSSKHELCVRDKAVVSKTSKHLKISAEGDVKLKAKLLTLITPDEIVVCKG